MSPRRIIFLVVALFASFGTIFLGKAWLGADRKVAVQAPPVAEQKSSTMVLVARGDLTVGKILRAENLRWQAWPDDGVSANYAVQGRKNLEDFIGNAVRSSLLDGEPITDARVLSPRDKGFLAAVLEPGTRAVTITLTPSAGNAGFIFPEDRVDVLATIQIPDRGDKKDVQHRAGETVLRDIRVLAIDQRADDQNKEITVGKTATLQVTPKQAEIISVVSDLGKLSLSLRSLPTSDEELAMVNGDEGRKGVSWTFDSDATKLIPPPNSLTTNQVVVYRRADGKIVEFARSSGAGGGQQASSPGDAH